MATTSSIVFCEDQGNDEEKALKKKKKQGFRERKVFGVI